MLEQLPLLHSIFTGLPKEITDEQGTYRTSIFRTRVDGPVEVEMRGLVGDKATQPYHGTRELAICCHPLAHYRIWNEQYSMNLQPGGVGENWTVEHCDDSTICVGDAYRIGSTLVRVTSPRSPCATQGRRVGRADWVALTIQENRTGFYVSVAEPGVVQPGDAWHLVERPNPGATIAAINHCYRHEWNVELAAAFAHLPHLTERWQQGFAKRLTAV